MIEVFMDVSGKRQAVPAYEFPPNFFHVAEIHFFFFHSSGF